LHRRAPGAPECASPPSRAALDFFACRQEVVVFAVADVEADPVLEHADDEPTSEQCVAHVPRLFEGHEQEVRPRGHGLERERTQGTRYSFSFVYLRCDVGWVGQPRERECGGDRRDLLWCLTAVQLGCRFGVGDRIADARAR
jgi:hypothetical protein